MVVVARVLVQDEVAVRGVPRGGRGVRAVEQVVRVLALRVSRTGRAHVHGGGDEREGGGVLVLRRVQKQQLQREVHARFGEEVAADLHGDGVDALLQVQVREGRRRVPRVVEQVRGAGVEIVCVVVAVGEEIVCVVVVVIRILRNNGWEYLSNVLYEISLVMISAVIFKYTNYLIVRIYFG